MEESVAIFVALIFTLILSSAIAEFFGRARHIGFGWTFALSATTLFIGGIIAIIASPSAKNEPTKGGKNYKIAAWVCFVFGGLNIIALNPMVITFFVLGAYLWELSKGDIINHRPKYYFEGSSRKIGQIGIPSSSNPNKEFKREKITRHQRLLNLQNLNKKGLLTDLEYQEKKQELLRKHYESEVFKSEEYQQLNDLLNAGVLSQQEFDAKVNALKEMKNSTIKEEEIEYTIHKENFQEEIDKDRSERFLTKDLNKTEIKFVSANVFFYRLILFAFILGYPFLFAFLSESDILELHSYWLNFIFIYWIFGMILLFKFLNDKKLMLYIFLLSLIYFLISINWKIGQWS